jgi:hypothetical protein
MALPITGTPTFLISGRLVDVDGAVAAGVAGIGSLSVVEILKSSASQKG